MREQSLMFADTRNKSLGAGSDKPATEEYKTRHVGDDVTTHLDVNGQWHDEDPDHDVGDGETHDKVVGDRLERPLPVHSSAHHQVPHQL